MASATIRVSFYGQIESLELDLKPDLLCEDVIWQCIEHIKDVVCEPNSNAPNTAAMYIHSFGLQLIRPKQSTEENAIWFPYWHKFVPKDFDSSKEKRINCMFRVRHRPPVEYDPKSVSVVGEYLFLQMVHDLLEGPAFPVHSFQKDRLQLLISISILLKNSPCRHNTEIVDHTFNTPQVGFWKLFSFSDGFSKPLRKKLQLGRLNFGSRIENHSTLRNVVQALKKRSMQVSHVKRDFINFLLEAVPDYCCEFYQVTPPGQSSPVSAMMKLHKFDYSNNGLYFGKEQVCPMSEIEGMTLVKPQNLQNEVWTVPVHRREGPSMSMPFKSELEANSFLSMAQGMVKLWIRWDRFLCCNVLTRGENLDIRLRSFGPLLDETAEGYLKDLRTKPDFDGHGFLIHRSTSEHQVYVVLSCRPGKGEERDVNNLQFERHHLLLGPGDCIVLKKVEGSGEGHQFRTEEDLHSSLLSQFGLQAQPRDCKVMANINSEYRKNMDSKSEGVAPQPLLLRQWDSDEREEQKRVILFPTELADERLIQDKNIRVRKFQVLFRNRALLKVQIVSNDERDAEAFREGLWRLETLRHFKPQRFIQLYNFVLERRMTVVMELAPQGDLLTYICKVPQSPVEKVDLMMQVVDVLQVMHDHAQDHNFHGNIRARKFLVFEESITRQVRLKMEYPGVTSMLDTKPLDDELNQERLAWLSPERQKDLPKVTYESECYSVGTTLAEIVYRTDDFAKAIKEGHDMELKEFLDTNQYLPLPLPGNENGEEVNALWESLWEAVIKPCWKKDPNLRPSPSILSRELTDLRTVACEVSKTAMKDSVVPLYYSDIGFEIEPAPSMEQLRILMQQKNIPEITAKNLKLETDNTKGGHFGTVYRGKMIKPVDSLLQGLGIGSSDEVPVAVKMMKSDRDVQDEEFRKELNIALQLENENIVKLLGAGYIPNPQNSACSQLVLIFEYMDGGTLEEYYKRCSKCQKTLLQLCHDVVKGMIYLSGKNMVHRDLAPRNVLLQSGRAERLVAKVSDFGLSRTLDPNYRFYRPKTSQELPWTIQPPECMGDNPLDQRFTSHADVWSFGLMLWQVFNRGRNLMQELCTAAGGRLQNRNPMKVALNLYKMGWRPAEHSSMPTNLYTIMKDCWAEDPNLRPPFVDLSKRLERVIATMPDPA